MNHKYRAFASTLVACAAVASLICHESTSAAMPPAGDTDLAWVEARANEWQPTKEERRFDEIGWAGTGILDGLELAKKHSRLLFVLTTYGNPARGRCDSGGFFVRSMPLAAPDIVDVLNGYFVPIYLDSASYRRDSKAVSAEERAMFEKLEREVKPPLSILAFVMIHVVNPLNGERIDGLGYSDCVDEKKVSALLKRAVRVQKLVKGDAVIKPTSQSRPDRPIQAGELAVHTVARHLPSGQSWNKLPAEDWVILSRNECQKLLPPAGSDAKVGDAYEIDKEVNHKLLINLYPRTPNFDVATNRIDSPPMKATVVSIQDGMARIRLDNEFKMKHPYFSIRDDDNFVKAKLVGFLDVNLATGDIRKIRIVTEKATYGENRFGGAIRWNA